MLSLETRNRLADLLLTISDGERQIEIVRQILCEQIDFEPYAAFRRIDRHRKTTINALDLLAFLTDNKVYYAESDCRGFIKRYDIDGDGSLNFNEFLFAVLPMDNPTLRTVATQRPNYDVAEDQLLSYDVEYSLAKVIDREIAFYSHVDHAKVGLHNCYDYNYIDAFATIDRFSTGALDYNNIEEFFRRQGIYPNEDEIVAILRRFDRNEDGQINREEFALGLEPQDPLLQVSLSKPAVNTSYGSPLRSKVLSPNRRKYESSNLRATSPLKKTVSPYESNFLNRTASPLRLTRSPLRKAASPFRKIASPARLTASPLPRVNSSLNRTSTAINRVSSPLRREASPTRRVASPLKRVASPTRRIASPLKRVASPPRRIASPTRRVASPIRREASPTRKIGSPLRNTTRSPLRVTSRSPLRETYLKSSFGVGIQARTASPVKFNPRESKTEFRSTGSTLKFSERVASPLQKTFSSSLGFKQTSPLRRTLLNKSPSKSVVFKNTSLEVEDAIQRRQLKSSEKSILKRSANYSFSASAVSPRRSGKKENLIQETEVRVALIDVLKQFIQIEKELEVAKQDLSLRPDFNLLDFFRTFDIDGRGSISSGELAEGMKRYGIFANKEELYLLLRRFDKDNDGKLKFSDFTEAFTCKQQEYANLLNNRTPINADLSLDIDQAFSEETKKSISRVLRMHLDNEGTTESLRQRLSRRFNFNVHEAFSYLDINDDGVISADELGDILDRNDFYATQRELRLLMDRLDGNRDGRITYSEFVQEMTPKSEKAF